jgi:Site-specific recombinase XerD
MKGCRPLEMSEVARAMEKLRGSRLAMRNRCLVLFGLNTGFRISELLSLRVGDVWRDGRVLERVVVERKNMKGKKSSRDVELNDTARAALRAWLPVLFDWRDSGADLYLFQSTKGGRMTRQQAGRIVSGLAHDLGMPPKIATHSLRKTFAATLYADELTRWRPGEVEPIRVTKFALGHASVETTERYIGINDTVVSRAVRSLNIGGNRGA